MEKTIIIFILFSCAFVEVFSFWSNCTHTNAPGPDLIESPFCDVERCFAVRGEYVLADIWATPIGAHEELLTTVTAFVFGLGVPIPIDYPYDNACNEIWKNGEIVSCPTVPFDQYKIGVKMLLPLNIPAFQNAVVRVEFFDRGEIAACGEVLATII